MKYLQSRNFPHFMGPEVSVGSILRHLNPANNSRSCLGKINFIFSFTFTLRSSNWCVCLRFSTKMLCAFLISDMCATCPFHPIPFNMITLIIFGEDKHLIMYLFLHGFMEIVRSHVNSVYRNVTEYQLSSFTKSDDLKLHCKN